MRLRGDRSGAELRDTPAGVGDHIRFDLRPLFHSIYGGSINDGGRMAFL